LTTLRVESRQYAVTAPAFNPPHLRFGEIGASVGVMPRLTVAEIFGITKLPSISCGVVCVILRLAVSVEHRLATGGQTANTRAR